MLTADMKARILKELTERLTIYKVILFGSYAWGTPGPDSDIDLIIVVDDDFMPRTFEESSRVYLSVALALRDLKGEVPMDLIVHTRPMHDRFLELDSMFAREVTQRGEVLYEKSDRGMA